MDSLANSKSTSSIIKIEEIEDGEPSKENSQDVLRKKKKGKAIVPTNGPALDSKVEAGSKTVVDGIKDESNGKLTEEGNGGGSESEEEDEDGFLVPHKREKSGNTMKKKKEKKMITPRNEATVDGKDESGGKTAADGIKNESGEKLTEEGNQGGPESKNEDEDEDGLPVPPKRKNSGNSQNEPPKKKQVKEGNVNDATDPAAAEQALPDVPKETKKSKKKKKKAKNKENEKRNTAETEGANGTSNEDNTDSLTMTEEKPALVEEKVQGKESSNNVRTFPNGLVIEELSMGKPDGKKAAPGNKVQPKVYKQLHVGDVFRFGHSSRLYILQGPTELMPPEHSIKGERQSFHETADDQERDDMEASLLRAKREASVVDGISWGMMEDAFEEDAKENEEEITWQTFKGQLTEKQQKTRDNILKRNEKVANLKKEIDAIQAKEIAQGGLTQGQQTQIARNEQRMEQPRWLGAIHNPEEEKVQIQGDLGHPENASDSSEFVGYKDSKRAQHTSRNEDKTSASILENAEGLVLRKPKEVDNKSDTGRENKDASNTAAAVDAEACAADAVALLLRHKRGFAASDEQDQSEKQDSTGGGAHGTQKRKSRKLGPEKPAFLAEASSDYDAWIPPQGQTGDGRTSLNDKYGY